jgi:hypothetical protein
VLFFEIENVLHLIIIWTLNEVVLSLSCVPFYIFVSGSTHEWQIQRETFKK